MLPAHLTQAKLNDSLASNKTSSPCPAFKALQDLISTLLRPLLAPFLSSLSVAYLFIDRFLKYSEGFPTCKSLAINVPPPRCSPLASSPSFFRPHLECYLLPRCLAKDAAPSPRPAASCFDPAPVLSASALVSRLSLGRDHVCFELSLYIPRSGVR